MQEDIFDVGTRKGFGVGSRGTPCDDGVVIRLLQSAEGCKFIPVFFDKGMRVVERISDRHFRRGIQLTVMVGVVMTDRTCP